MTINPYSNIKFNSFTVEERKQLRTFFVFTGFQNLNTTQGLIESLSELNQEFTYSLFLEKEDFNTSLVKIENKINSLVARLSNQEVDDTALLDKIARFVKRLTLKFNFLHNSLMEEDLELTLNLKEELKENKEALTSYSLIFSVKVQNQTEAKKIIDKVENLASQHKINLPCGYFIQNNLYKSNNQQKNVDNEFIFAGENRLVQLFNPLVFQSNEPTETSVFLGSTSFGNSPFFVDYKLNTTNVNHSLILGASGNGKSALVKSMVWQFAKLGYRVLILDPQNEYKKLTQALNGSDVDLSESKGINIFDLDKYSSMQDLTGLVKLLFSSIVGEELREDETKLINFCLHNAKKSSNSNKFQAFLAEIQRQPKLSIYLNALNSENVVKLLTTSQGKDIDKAQVTRFSFNDLSNSELTLFVTITSQVISGIMSDKDTPTILLIDEAFKFFNSNSGKQIESWLRQMRKLNTAVFLIDQSVRSYGDISQTIWENTKHHLLFAHNLTESIKIDQELYKQVQSLKKYNFLYHSSAEAENYTFAKSTIPDNIVEYV